MIKSLVSDPIFEHALKHNLEKHHNDRTENVASNSLASVAILN